MTIFDIVIPVGPNDYNILKNMIEYTLKNIMNYRNIYIISSKNFEISNTIYINENEVFPFNFISILEITKSKNRSGWYFQQLIKLYSGLYIKDILNNYLCIDVDTFFLKKIFFFEDNLPLYNEEKPLNEYLPENYEPYFIHMKKLHPTLVKKSIICGISHHMVFENHILKKLFKLVEDFHNIPFWKVFLNNLDINHIEKAGASEYEIYFNYSMIYNKNNFKLRKLKWINYNKIIHDTNLDYISIHYYLRD